MAGCFIHDNEHSDPARRGEFLDGLTVKIYKKDIAPRVWLLSYRFTQSVR